MEVGSTNNDKSSNKTRVNESNGTLEKANQM